MKKVVLRGLLFACTLFCMDGALAQCSNADSVIHNTPIHDTAICRGDTLTLHANGGTSYTWSPNYNINSTSASSPNVWPAVSTVYIVQIHKDSCTKIDTVLVTVNDCHCEDTCNWSLTGNSAVQNYHFIGPINNAAFRIRTSNLQRMIVTSSGQVGIGTNAPGAAFELNSQVSGLSGMRFTQPISVSAANGTALSVDGSGNVILVSSSTGSNNAWNLWGNSITDSCSWEFLGTKNEADLRFRTNDQHRMRLTQFGALSLEPYCGANFSKNATNLLVGDKHYMQDAVYNITGGAGNYASNSSNTLGIGSGTVLDSADNSAVFGVGLRNLKPITFHFGSGDLVNAEQSSFMVGWEKFHTILADQEGLAIKTAATGTPARTGGDMATARLDVQAAAYTSELENVARTSGVRFRDLPDGKGNVLVIDAQGYILKSDISTNRQQAEEIKELRQELDELKAQMRALLQSRDVVQKIEKAEGSLEVNPNPFSNSAVVKYRIGQNFKRAQVIVQDANGNALKRIEVANSEGQVQVSEIQSTAGMLLFRLVVDGREVVSLKAVKY